MPFSIIGSTDDVQTADGRVVKGRQYSWGVAEGRITLQNDYYVYASYSTWLTL